jgi:AraC-like DNA-binding protein
MSPLRQLFGAAKRGLEITGPGREAIIDMIERFPDCPDYRRPLHLLDILFTLKEEAVTRQLSSPNFIHTYLQTSSTKVDVIYEYVLNNFKTKISLGVAADLVSMNPTAFSRYFRQKTNKTFIQYVNEVRIGYACKLFSSSDHSISEIAYASGFNNLSHFNKQFKAIKSLTPSAYVKQYAGKSL